MDAMDLPVAYLHGGVEQEICIKPLQEVIKLE